MMQYDFLVHIWIDNIKVFPVVIEEALLGENILKLAPHFTGIVGRGHLRPTVSDFN